MGRAFRPGRMHDQTAVRAEGIADLFRQHPQVKAKVDAGYQGPGQGIAGQGPGPAAEAEEGHAPGRNRKYESRRHEQSSERICVEHANAEHKQWRPLQRYLGRREYFDQTYAAIAGLVSDRAAQR